MSLFRSPALLATLIPAFLALGCSQAPEDGDCAKLQAHVIDLELAATKLSDADKTKQRALLTKESETFVTRCNEKLKSVQVECALKTESVDAFEACDKDS